jgi:hypothetical protein
MFFFSSVWLWFRNQFSDSLKKQYINIFTKACKKEKGNNQVNLRIEVSNEVVFEVLVLNVEKRRRTEELGQIYFNPKR